MTSKRMMDIVISIFLAVPAAIICLIAAFAHLIVERNNPLFAQERVGKQEKPFTILKMRTMKLATGDAATHTVDSSNVTFLGKVLRKFKIDELPQLINILTGEMSFIGPRPCLPNQTELIEARRRLGVFDVVPGISGLAQVSGVDMSNPEKLAIIDSEYIHSRTLKLDLKLCLRTILGAGFGDRTKERS